jgi:hypothetical protein
MQPKNTKNKFPCYKRYKKFWMKKPNATISYKEEAKIWKKKSKLDENRIKIGENFILHP